MHRRPDYGWLIVGIAAAAMVATLPARTVGLGLITEPLLAELDLTRTRYARINLAVTLLGSLGALVAGPLTDRLGIRIVLSATLLILGCLAAAMGSLVTAASLAIFLVLVRGVGQSALSTVSVTCVGKWFTSRLAIAMGVYSVLVAIGFSAAIVATQSQVEAHGWRPVWIAIGGAIFALGVLSVFLTRNGPALDPTTGATTASEDSALSLDLPTALKTPCFWVFGISMALYAGVLAAISLFNQSILEELGFGAATFRYAMAGLMSAGLLGNLLAALAVRRLPLPRVVALSLAILAAVLVLYPFLRTPGQVIAHASVFGFCGGVFTVLFFTGFGHAFGRDHLGKIQGCAQLMVVTASALGPWLLASVHERTESYFSVLLGLSPVFAIGALLAWRTKLPSRA